MTTESQTKIIAAEISVRGRTIQVPAARIGQHDVIVSGRWPRIAAIRDEEWLPSSEAIAPLHLAKEIAAVLPADIFAFSGALDVDILSGVRYSADNAAVIDTSDFKAWWESLPQEARKNTRRAAKRGVEIRLVNFDHELAAGIKAIYDETPVRQGRPFWHYGKDLATVQRENATYLDRAAFLGAYVGPELIGFMKWVYVGNVARIMQILCLNAHQDKRPIIALLAKAAEICSENGMRYLVYGKYTYGRKADSSIAEFKRRLGFQQKDFPRYFVPLNWRGRSAIALGLHTGLKELLPTAVLTKLLEVRAAWLSSRLKSSQQASAETSTDSAAQ